MHFFCARTYVIPGLLPDPPLTHFTTELQLPPALIIQIGLSSVRKIFWQQSIDFCLLLNWQLISCEVTLAFAPDVKSGIAKSEPIRAAAESESDVLNVFMMGSKKFAIMIDRWRKYGKAEMHSC
jgi:hypothetical protein